MANRANVFVSKSQPKSQMTENAPIFFNRKFIRALEKQREVKFGPEILRNLHMESSLNKYAQKTVTRVKRNFKVAPHQRAEGTIRVICDTNTFGEV